MSEHRSDVNRPRRQPRRRPRPVRHRPADGRPARARHRHLRGSAMEPVPLISRASLSEQAYAAIKGMINRLELKPGEPITEAQLAAMLDISKSPIRAALIHLQRDGLVTITPYTETVASEINVTCVNSIYE